MAYKLGLTLPAPGEIPLRFASYLNFRALPTPPDEIGHYQLIPQTAWGDLGNTTHGDCAVAGACHQSMLWTVEGSGTPAPFTTDVALANYSQISGFSLTDPAGKPYPVDDNPTDKGIGIGQLSDYWLNTGLLDANNQRHQIVAVCDLNPGDLRELWLAVWLFQSAGMAFDFPDSAIDQSEHHQTWDVIPGAQSAGGHYVPAFGCHNGLGVAISWGEQFAFTPAFYQTYSAGGLVALSEEMMKLAKSVDGFDDATLRDDINELRKESRWPSFLR